MSATEVTRITDDSTKAEIELAITNVLATTRRKGRAWSEQGHAKIDALLEDWERAER